MQIFVSRPTWVAPEFEAGLETFLMLLKNIGVTARTLGATDYPSKAPLDEVIEIMNECQGAVILGYPQVSITSGAIKGHAIDSELTLSTEWNHIEAALAYSKGLPLLAVHHSNISRGIFDRGVMNAFLHSCDLTTANWCMGEALNGAIIKWKINCTEGKANFITTAPIDKNLHLCPNCTTSTKPIYMSELPAEFSDFGKWHCTKCEYMTSQ